MGMIAEIFSNLRRKNQRSKSNYVFYKIVDFLEKQNEYLLQCINTKAIFHATTSDIFADKTILYGLHPLQSCYIGIEYAQLLKQDESLTIQYENIEALNKEPDCGYGMCSIQYQDRKGKLCIINKKTKEEFILDPCEVAFSEGLLKEFDAKQAFYIGILTGIKLTSTPPEQFQNAIKKKSHLKLIKTDNSLNV